MLVALIASLCALIATAHAQDLCGTDSFGAPISTGPDMVKQLPDVYMPAGSREVMISIPEDNVCAPVGTPGSVVGGILLRACDYGAAPLVRLTSLRQAVVTRVSYISPGVVRTTVQCVPAGMQYKYIH